MQEETLPAVDPTHLFPMPHEKMNDAPYSPAHASGLALAGWKAKASFLLIKQAGNAVPAPMASAVIRAILRAGEVGSIWHVP